MPFPKITPLRGGAALVLLTLVISLGGRFLSGPANQPRQTKEKLAVPVEVAAIVRGPMVLRRTFSGTIEPRARFTVAPKVSGRIERLHVDVADQVKRGQLLVELADSEFKQAVAEARANRAVAEAHSVEAASHLEIAGRELNRTKTLHARGIASDSTLDSAQAKFLAAQAAVQVARATAKREEAALATAEIRLGYTRIHADWQQGDDQRTVAERYIDEGNTVAANTPLFSIVELDPLIAVIHVTEKDYPRLNTGQQVSLRTDAYPRRVFTGTVSRIAPIFRISSRQARLEIDLPNPDHLLKPGMFSRCTLELRRIEDAVSVPEMAITSRNNQSGVFLVSDDGLSVKWHEVTPGMQDSDYVQLIDAHLSGRVVTLGQQLIEDGSTIRISGEYTNHAAAQGEM